MKETKDESTEDSNRKKKEEDIWADPELAELLFASEENRNNETVEPHEAVIEEELLNDAPDEQDPDKAHELYYDELEARLKKFLKGVSTEAKAMIRGQKRLLLNDGEMRRRDNRQAYYYRIQQAIDIVDKWRELCAAGTIPLTESRIFRLYCMFKDAVEAITKKKETK